MKHFNFNEIKEKGSCIDFVESVLGIPVHDNRCPAKWRNGERDSVRIEKEKWFDHAAEEGGGLVELCARAKFGGMGGSEIQQAQEFLGEWLHLDEMKLKKSTPGGRNRHDELIAEGYKEKARYEYRDLDGKLIYFVCRMEHPRKKKEFVQGTPDHWGIGDVTPIPYNWAAVHKSDWCVIVEGEKDVETLKRLGVPATTNSGGAKKWQHSFSEYLRGKHVVILPDNDTVGQEHAQLIARDLYGIAADVKIVQCSTMPKGDVTDYIEKEKGTWEALKAKIDATEIFSPDLTEKGRAREANLTAFSNFEIIETENRRGGRGREEKVPRRLTDMIADLHVRLMGAPYRVGEELFDRDHDTKKICYLYDTSDLFSWIARKTGQVVQWSKIEGCVTKQEFFAALKSEAKVFSAISFTPDFPVRKDVYYTHPALPQPSKDNAVFWRFVDFFNPVDDVNRSLLTAFIMAPIFYKPMAARPLWIIDSPNGQGSGKSAIPEMVAFLYGEDWNEGRPIDVSLYDLEKNYTEIVKRIISTTGRNARILRLDNVTGTLRSSNLAMLVTAGSITGRATYGRGEENRPNNLTYVVTINGATVDTDIASRAYYIMVAKPKMNPKWGDDIQDYIRENRLQIFADILDVIRNHKPFDVTPVTRVPQFEVTILQAACQTEEQYQKVMNFLMNRKEETNTDEELARRIEEELTQKLINTPALHGHPAINPQTDRIFIRSCILEAWFLNSPWIGRKTPTEIIRNLAKTGMITQVDPVLMRWPAHNRELFQRRSGIMWNYARKENAVRVLGFTVNVSDTQKSWSKAVVEIAAD